MVSEERDLTRVASVLIAIGLRILEKESRKEGDDEFDCGVRPGVD